MRGRPVSASNAAARQASMPVHLNTMPEGMPGEPRRVRATKNLVRTCRGSALATALLTGLKGIEIGGAVHNQFFLDTLQVSDGDAFYAGQAMRLDVIATMHRLPFRDAAFDFVISSHVLEHVYDPIAALLEQYRVIKSSGYLFMIVPHKERTFDYARSRTTLAQLISRHDGYQEIIEGHQSVWITADLVEIVRYLHMPIHAVQDVDDKVGNGFTVVVKK